ncbi:MAG: ammonium transporter, partial [Alkalispirochaeta sp.]
MKRRLIIGMILFAVIAGGQVVAQEVLPEVEAAFDMIWLTVAGALVFFMQAGFAMVETGLTRAKNAGNII